MLIKILLKSYLWANLNMKPAIDDRNNPDDEKKIDSDKPKEQDL